MAHNPPNPDRFLENHPQWRAMGAVLWRYGDIFGEDEGEAIAFITPMIAGGVDPVDALMAFEARPMDQRRYGRPAEDTVWGYQER